MGRFRIARRKKRGNDSFSVQKKDSNNIWQDTPFTPQQQGEQSNNLANVQKRLQLAKESNFDFSQIPLRSPDSNSTNIQRSTGSGHSDVIQADLFDRFRSQESIARRNRDRDLRNTVFDNYKYRRKKSRAWAFTKDWAKTIFWNWRKNYGNRNDVDEYNPSIERERATFAKKLEYVNNLKSSILGSPYMKKVDPYQDNFPFITLNDIFFSSSGGGTYIKDRGLFNFLDFFASTEFNNENVRFMKEMHFWNKKDLLKNRNDETSVNQMMAIANVYVNSDGGLTSDYSQYLPVPANNHAAPLSSGSTEINIGSGVRSKIKRTYIDINTYIRNGQKVPREMKQKMLELLNKAAEEIHALFKDPLGRLNMDPACKFAIREAAKVIQVSKPNHRMPGGMAKARVRQAIRKKQRMN